MHIKSKLRVKVPLYVSRIQEARENNLDDTRTFGREN
jgi:hypothetical protein